MIYETMSLPISTRVRQRQPFPPVYDGDNMSIVKAEEAAETATSAREASPERERMTKTSPRRRRPQPNRSIPSHALCTTVTDGLYLRYCVYTVGPVSGEMF